MLQTEGQLIERAKLVIVQTIIWGWLTSAIGLAILVLLFFYGIEYGTWIDEAGQLPSSPPTFVIPFVIAGLGLILFIGGLVLGASASTQRTEERI